jgi:hypothetical protein
MSDRRIDSWEQPLTDDQRWEVYERLRRFPIVEVGKWIAETHSIPAPSRSALYRFKAHMESLESGHRIQQALSVKANVKREMEAIGDMDGELEFSWTQLAMESAMRGDMDAGSRYLAMAMKLRNSALEREKLRLKQEAEKREREALSLMREKFESQERRNAEARAKLNAVVASKGGIAPETLAQIEEAVSLL